jgi:hypothetical protein
MNILEHRWSSVIYDKRYPNFLWLPCYSKGISHEGLSVLHRDYFAYYSSQHKQWDFASGVNFAYPPRDKNPWYDVQSTVEYEKLASELRSVWSSLPQGNQRRVFFIAYIRYEDIIEIDDVPDEFLRVPTVFVSFRNQRPPFAKVWDIRFDRGRSRLDSFVGGETAGFHKGGNVRLFPDKFRDLNWERSWFEKNGIAYATVPYDLPMSDRQRRSGMEIPD